MQPALLLLLLLLLAAISAATQLPLSQASSRTLVEEQQFHVAKSVCDGTLYPELCLSTMATIQDLHTKSLPEIISATVKHIEKEVVDESGTCGSLRKKPRVTEDFRQRTALADCQELFTNTLSELNATLKDLSASLSENKTIEVKTFLSAAMTNQYTCLDGFAYCSKKTSVRPSIEPGLVNITKLVSNSLAICTKLKGSKHKPAEEEFPEYGKVVDGFPKWVSGGVRRLLQASSGGVTANASVAKDGSGQFTNISAAVEAAPSNSKTRYVIKIKAGTYAEYIDVAKTKKNLMFIGDGIGKTVITGNRNVQDGWTTFRSATVAVVGEGFVARDLTIENTAGASKHQAVALRVGSDLSAFYRCSIVGYQDTLYVHSLRQFFRECDIYGTVDFIFGNAAVVFQSCNLYARKPDPNQKNAYTAQGREDPNQNTGISIVSSKITATSDLVASNGTFKTYLGRPWKQYSRTVIMTSSIDDIVDPAGWLEWNGTFALSTLYYAEYLNTGAGANTSRRVTWPGYRVINDTTTASVFTVNNFIQGNNWLPSAGVPFSSGL